MKSRTGVHSMPRYRYLQRLVTEFQDSNNLEDKEQVIAHLSNFAYDPINYEHLLKLNVLDLFLDTLEDETDTKLQEFAIGGLCNFCLDPRVAKLIFKHNGVPLIIKGLSSTNIETVLSSVTTLYYLMDSEHKSIISTKPVQDCISKYAKATQFPRLSNISQLFLKKTSTLQ
uniref:Armadillo repeat-containing domain-containing protein n=1 Tax=Arcella intermedia TaxID=1963864 RepID=A0A6B2LM46_9EUKA